MEIFFIISFLFCVFSLFKIVNNLNNRIVNSAVLIHCFVLLSINGQIVRMYIIGENFFSYYYSFAVIYVGIVFYEIFYTVYKPKIKSAKYLSNKNYEINYFVCTLVSLPILLAWYLYFSKFGGAFNYITTGMIDKRVALGEGLGVYKVLINLFPLIVYVVFVDFLKSLNSKKNVKSRLIAFLSFFSIWIILCIPMGSRGGIVVPVICFFILYNKLYKKIALKKMLVFGVCILALLNVLSELRTEKNISSFDKGVISRVGEALATGWGYEHRLLSMANTIRYVPSRLDYQYGGTYLALVTQFLPRKYFPWKFAPGGVLISEHITRIDAYRGTSNDQASIFGESYLNFGLIGVIIMLSAGGILSKHIDVLFENCYGYWASVFLMISVIFTFFNFQGDFVNTNFSYVLSLLFLAFFKKINSLSQ